MNEHVHEWLSKGSDQPRGLLKKLIQQLLNIHYGQLTLRVPGHDPIVIRGPESGPEATITLNRPEQCIKKIILREATGLGEAYMAGDWETPNLTQALFLLGMNEDKLTQGFAFKRLGRFLDRLQHLWRRNSKTGSRKNIAYHYDLGNDFYRTWLDQSMTYSSAVFHSPDDSLEQAQAQKYQRLLDQLAPKAGDHILEIGCGWGGFAEHAARQGYRVTGITLSQEQLHYAQQRVDAAGLSHLVTLQLRDYRDLNERYDHVVSIEMFEAVGETYWDTYFQCVHDSLKPGGRAALQIITFEDARFDTYRTGADFIQKYIFPGGMLPSVSKFNEMVAAQNLHLKDQSFFGIDYAETLARWHDAFNHQRESIQKMGYDPTFQRMWRFYLAYCEAGFRVGRIDLMHATLEKT